MPKLHTSAFSFIFNCSIASSPSADNYNSTMWEGQCGRGNVGGAMWEGQCGRGNVGGAMWEGQCGRGNVGREKCIAKRQ